MKNKLLTLVLALTSLSAFAGNKPTDQRENMLFKPSDSSHSIVSKAVNKGAKSCLSSCRFQLQLCRAYTPSYKCQVKFETCVEACFN